MITLQVRNSQKTNFSTKDRFEHPTSGAPTLCTGILGAPSSWGVRVQGVEGVHYLRRCRLEQPLTKGCQLEGRAVGLADALEHAACWLAMGKPS